MKFKKIPIALALVVLILCIALEKRAIADQLYIVASESTQKKSQTWYDFLEFKEIPFTLLLLDEFRDLKEEKYIVIMGGINELKDLRNLFKQVLTNNELEWLTQKGNGNMYLKSDIWTQGQKIIVFAGSDQSASIKAREVNKEEWFEMFSEWFDLEDDPDGMLPY